MTWTATETPHEGDSTGDGLHGDGLHGGGLHGGGLQGGAAWQAEPGVLLCTRHHVLVTLGTWTVRMVNGTLQVRPPRSVDPLRRWVLNPRRGLREATTHTLRAVQQLLRTEPPDPPPDAQVPDILSPHSTCDC